VLKNLLFGEKTLTEDQLSDMHKAEDLEIFETAAGYKCHHVKSREAAYTLFLFLVENLLTLEEFDLIVKEYWTELVMRMEKPTERMYDPTKCKRADNGFAGLKN